MTTKFPSRSRRYANNMKLSHCAIMPPLTRVRAKWPGQIPNADLSVKYYGDRPKRPGTIIILEAAVISPQARRVDHAPGILNDAQVQEWKKISKKVDDNDS